MRAVMISFLRINDENELCHPIAIHWTDEQKKKLKTRRNENREIFCVWILSIKWSRRRKNWKMSINAIAKLLSNCNQTWSFRNPLRFMTFNRMHERTLNILKNIHINGGWMPYVRSKHMCCELSNQFFCFCFSHSYFVQWQMRVWDFNTC